MDWSKVEGNQSLGPLILGQLQAFWGSMEKPRLWRFRDVFFGAGWVSKGSRLVFGHCLGLFGCGSQLNRRGKPQVLVHVFHFLGFDFGTGFLSHSHLRVLFGDSFCGFQGVALLAFLQFPSGAPSFPWLTHRRQIELLFFLLFFFSFVKILFTTTSSTAGVGPP